MSGWGERSYARARQSFRSMDPASTTAANQMIDLTASPSTRALTSSTELPTNAVISAHFSTCVFTARY